MQVVVWVGKRVQGAVASFPVGRQVSLVPGPWVERWGVFPGELCYLLLLKAAVPLSLSRG